MAATSAHGCTPLGGDRATGPEAAGGAARVSVVLQVVPEPTSRSATLSAYYRTGGAAGAIVPLARAVSPLAPGLQAVPVSVDLAPCLGDATGPRTADGACPVFVAVALRDAADALVDSVTIGPLLARPGVALSPAPVTLAIATQVALTVPDTLRVGDSLAVRAVVRDSAGVLLDRAVQWSSSDPTRATVSPEGRVRALQPGAVTLTARAFRASGSVSRTVLVDVNTVSLTLRDTVRVNDTLTVTATLRDRQGQPVVSGPPVTWTSSAPGVATLDNAGRLIALAPGTVTLTGESQGRVGSITRTVLADVAAITLRLPDTVRVNDTVTVTATLRDRQGQPVSGPPVTWSSSAPAVATLDNTGRLIALAPGTVTLTGESQGRVGSITRTVLADIAAITLSLPNTVRVNDTVQVSATVTNRAGQPVNSPVVTYGTTTPTVVTVSSTGRLVALAPGTATITATSAGRNATAPLTVTPLPAALQAVALSPATASVPAGQTLTLTPTPTTGGAGVSVTYGYESSAPSVATVSTATGVVTGIAPGTATITVTAAGSGAGYTSSTRTATASISVAAPLPNAIQSVAVLPASVNVAIGQSLALTTSAVVGGAGVTIGYLFQSDAPSTSLVSSAGVLTGVATGTATITVTATGSGIGYTTAVRTATTSVTVTSSPALGIGFEDDQFSLIPPGSFQMGQLGVLNATPVRTVTLSAFRMQRTEVTQRQWSQIMTGSPRATPSFFAGCGDTCPVESVSWDDIQVFLTRLNAQIPGRGYRLPTEAEWEYAARAGTTGLFGVSGDLCGFAWAAACASQRTWPVAQKLPNAWGLHDMHGNIWEWVNDWYGTYPSTNQANPTGPSTGIFRVLRGGYFGIVPEQNSSAFRTLNCCRPNDAGRQTGFRLVRNP